MPKPKVAPMPQSWRLRDWPPEVVPNSTSAAKHLIRTHREELRKHGALSRVGRDIIVIGEGYAAFLASKMKRVDNYSIAPNRTPTADAA
jgi:hypothetical protein